MLTSRQRRHATIPASAASAVASWALISGVAGVHLSVRFPHSAATAVGLGTIVTAASIATLLGWGLLAALERKSTHPRRNWVTTAVVVFLASLSLPIAFATTTFALIGLVVIHVVVAVVAVTGLAPTAKVRFARATSHVSARFSQPMA